MGALWFSPPFFSGGRMRINRPKKPTLIRYNDDGTPIDRYRKSVLPKFGTNNPNITVLRKIYDEPEQPPE